MHYNLFGNPKKERSFDSIEKIDISIRRYRRRYHLRYDLVFNDGYHMSTRVRSYELGGYKDKYYSMMELHELIKDNAVVTAELENLDLVTLVADEPELLEALYSCFSE